MNTVCLMGRLTSDPDIKQLTSGALSARYMLAVDRGKNKNGEQETDFIRCIEFGKSAEFAQNYLRKGMKICITGSIRTGSYTDKETNKTVYTTEVLVREHFFCEKKADGSGAPQQQYQPQQYQQAPQQQYQQPPQQQYQQQPQQYQQQPQQAPQYQANDYLRDFNEVISSQLPPF